MKVKPGYMPTMAKLPDPIVRAGMILDRVDDFFDADHGSHGDARKAAEARRKKGETSEVMEASDGWRLFQARA